MVEPDEIKGSFDSGDPNTTNLYLGNLNPKVMYKIYLIINMNKCYYYRFIIFRLLKLS